MKPVPSSRFSIPLAAGVVCLAAISAKGAILSQWTFDAISTAPSNVIAGATAGNFSTPGTFPGTTGPVASTTVSGVGGTAPYVFGAGGLSTSEASAITDNDFYTFTLTPTVGNAVSFSAVSFYGWANTGFNADSYTFFVRSNQTGNTTLDTFTQTIELANATSPSGTSQFSINLSGVAALQNVSSATTFTIGVYVNGLPAVGNLAGNMRIDGIQLDGTVGAVPEPLSPILSGLGLGLLAIRRRR